MRYYSFDDGLRPELLQKSFYDGILEIPQFEPQEIRIPKGLIPFSCRKHPIANERFIHFYEHDKNYSFFSSHPEKIVEELKILDGCISPDNSILPEASLSAQIANLYLSRRNGVFMQSQGIYIIPNIRWGDERTFTNTILPEPIAFLGIPKNHIVSIATYGCCQKRESKELFHKGLIEMLRYLTPQVVIVYGPMPKNIFFNLTNDVKYIQFDNWTKEIHELYKMNLNKMNLKISKMSKKKNDTQIELSFDN